MTHIAHKAEAAFVTVASTVAVMGLAGPLVGSELVSPRIALAGFVADVGAGCVFAYKLRRRESAEGHREADDARVRHLEDELGLYDGNGNEPINSHNSREVER